MLFLVSHWSWEERPLKKILNARAALEIKKSIWKGILVLLPLGVIIFLLKMVIEQMDSYGSAFLSLFMPSQYLFPLAGFFFLLFIIYLLGRILVYEEKTEKYFFYRFLQRIPLLGELFKPQKKEKFLRPCLFWETPTVLTLGVIAGEQRIEGLLEPKIIVSIINPPPSKVMVMEKKRVIRLNLSFAEVLQISSSLGLRHPEITKPIPWEDETMEQCLERLELCP